MSVLGLVRQPLGLVLKVSEIALEAATGVVKLAQSALAEHPQPSVDDRWAPVASEEPQADPEPEAPIVAAAPPPPAPVPPPAPAPAPPLAEDHVDEGISLVAEFAEEGAEDGAHAELHVDEPWDGYRDMKAAEIVKAIEDADPTAVAAVQLFEAAGKKRRSVLQAAERRLAVG